MKMIRQRYSNDCTICCVAMVTGLDYETVEAAAKRAHPDYAPGGVGTDVYKVLNQLKQKCDWRHKKTLTDDLSICSVDSLNQQGVRHAVVTHNGNVYDPSLNIRATISHVHKTLNIQYYNFRDMS